LAASLRQRPMDTNEFIGRAIGGLAQCRSRGSPASLGSSCYDSVEHCHEHLPDPVDGGIRAHMGFHPRATRCNAAFFGAGGTPLAQKDRPGNLTHARSLCVPT